MDNFTYKYYKSTLKNALNKGYNFIKCNQYHLIKNYDKLIILRHDVDLNIDNALILAKIESELGIYSSYFIRLHSKFYNPLELKNYQIIKNIENLGHEISLHIEPMFASSVTENPIDYIKNEISIFNQLFQTQIKGVTNHEPTRTNSYLTPQNVLQFNLEYEGHSEFFTQNTQYISDSGGRWREGDLLYWVDKNTPKLYVNTHPVWWYNLTSLENY